DVILISPGTYNESLVIRVADITLQSLDPMDATTVESTIIDGPRFPTKTIDMKAHGVVLSGLNIRGSTDGIQCNYFDKLIERCVISSGVIYKTSGIIQDNTITAEGGIVNSHGLIQRNVIMYGKGIRSDFALVPLTATILDNYIAHKGIGISLCKGRIVNNTIVHNRVGLSSCDGLIRNNTIAFNTWEYGCGLAYCDGTIEGNIIYGNEAVNIPPGSPDRSVGAGLLNCNGTIRNNFIFGNYSENRGAGLAGCSGSIIIHGVISDCAYLITMVSSLWELGEGHHAQIGNRKSGVYPTRDPGRNRSVRGIPL
ncbi:MAG: hypothetical protein KC917_14880, partial [Candidatus Omnitrophica bacterium]|nr:hypothetical protein [Candidatus Omnitrophota bacterium]